MRILVTIPTTGRECSEVKAACLGMSHDTRAEIVIESRVAAPYAHNMNAIALDVVRGGYDYWITFDDDNPPRSNPIDLVFLGKDIIGCPTPVWCFNRPDKLPYFWSVFTELPDGLHEPYKGPFDGLQRVDAVGSGCMVIARRVLEAVRAPFMRQWDENGIVTLGCDLSFCRKARAAGFEVYAHYGHPCRHFKTVDLTEVVESIAHWRGLSRNANHDANHDAKQNTPVSH